MAKRVQYQQQAQPGADTLIAQISFQIHQVYKNREQVKNVQPHHRLNLNVIDYDFTLETEVKNVFERADAETEAIQTAEITENEENMAPSEAFEDVEQVEVCDEPDGDNSCSAQIEAPPIPKRCFEKENNENDSGVSSGGENPGESKNQFSTPLQPTTTNSIPTPPKVNPNGSVLDIFDISRCSDPFNAAHLNSINEKEILAQVFPPTQSPPDISKEEPIVGPIPKPRIKSAQTKVASSLQTVLAARQVQNQKQKSQNFSKSAMAALNSLPVIEAAAGTNGQYSRPTTPVATQSHHMVATVPPSIFPTEFEQFGEQLVQMGYEKLIVLKTIQLFGNDQEKCLDFLSAHSELLSSSGSSSAEIIRALSVCEFSKDETSLFLQNSKRYLEMGFEHQAVRNALIRYPNEPAFVLESLMTHHSK